MKLLSVVVSSLALVACGGGGGGTGTCTLQPMATLNLV
jgi:hypothetical protein